ncbi:MAG TPA: EAL domain-containing protein [Casimicrobiaceae bacterium]|nr:EAL domain-containing protein [Casimicrobiaceae bacterium]
MKNESTVLRSKFARRIVALLVIAALIPIAVTAALSLSPGHDRSALTKVLLPVTVVALLVVALLSIRGVRRMLRPLEMLIEGTRRAGNQDFSARLGDEELGELATSFNSMASRLGSQFSTLVTLADIDDAILSRHELDRIVDTAVLRMREIVPADFVSMAIVDRSAPETMRVVTRAQAGDEALERVCTMHAAADTAAIAAHADGVWIERGRDLPPYLVPIAKRGAASMLALPIVSQNAVVGAVVLGFKGARTLTDEERARARTLADRVAVAFATATRDEQLYYQANYDALTGLPNRLYFKDQLVRRLAQAQREAKPFALLFIDLDRFKTINDTLGHAAGDEVLRQVAARLRRCVRETDTVTRLGGDEFTIILSQIRSARDPESVALNVVNALAQPITIGGAERRVSASVGIAVYPDDGTSADRLLYNADVAMYRAKELGRGRYEFFEQRMNVAAHQRVSLERELRDALEGSEFSLGYRPVLDVRSGRIAGAEAVLRWERAGRERLPADFFDVAEATGLIEPIGEWMLTEACRQFQAWRGAGVDLPRVAVDASVRQFRQREFVEKVRGIVAASALAPYCLELEIDEGLLLDADSEIARALDELRAIGVTLCLDNFGVGQASLACLTRFPVENVKIARSLTLEVGGETGSGALVAAIVATAHVLNKRVVADGVKTEKQAALLGRLGCHQIQGPYLGGALGADRFAEFVMDTAAGAAARPAFLTRGPARARQG